MSTPGALNRTTAPSAEVLTLDEAKAHLHVDDNEQDLWITTAIVAARQDAEEFTESSFITQNWTLNLDNWPDETVIELAQGPVQSVTTVKYYDTDGVQKTLVSGTDYQVDVASTPARITTEPDVTWPSVETGRLNAIEVIYKTGYGDASTDVPQGILNAVKLILGHLNEHREDVIEGRPMEIPKGARHALWHYRMTGA